MSKVLEVEITENNYRSAIGASSGGCLIADAIKEQYPELSLVSVDVATIRCTDRKAGKRYTWLTPQSVSDTLLFFDQGFKETVLPKKLRIAQLIRVQPIKLSRVNKEQRREQRAQRLAELETKEQRGEELTRDEKISLKKIRNYKPGPERPTSYGDLKVEITGDSVIRHGGTPERNIRKRGKNPNMLAGRIRHFGAKTAQPSQVFREAVTQEVERREQERGQLKISGIENV